MNHASLIEHTLGAGSGPILPALSTREAGRIGELASLIIKFNLEPALYAHASWLPFWADQKCSVAVQTELSRSLLRERRLEADFDWTLENPAARFFLLDPDSFHRLVLTVGLLAHRDKFRQIVHKPQLQWLRTQLGDVLDSLWLTVAETIDRSNLPISLSPTEDRDGVESELLSALKRTGEEQLFRLFDAADPQQRAVAGRGEFFAARKSAPTNFLPMEPMRARRMTDGLISDIFPRWISQWTWLF